MLSVLHTCLHFRNWNPTTTYAVLPIFLFDSKSIYFFSVWVLIEKRLSLNPSLPAYPSLLPLLTSGAYIPISHSRMWRNRDGICFKNSWFHSNLVSLRVARNEILAWSAIWATNRRFAIRIKSIKGYENNDFYLFFQSFHCAIDWLQLPLVHSVMHHRHDYIWMDDGSGQVTSNKSHRISNQQSNVYDLIIISNLIAYERYQSVSKAARSYGQPLEMVSMLHIAILSWLLVLFPHSIWTLTIIINFVHFTIILFHFLFSR